jgi:multiple sugar transport system permease protein
MSANFRPEVKLAQLSPAPSRFQACLRKLWRGQSAGYLFVAPSVLFLLFFTAYPLVRGVIMSMTEVSKKGEIGRWIGFANWPLLFQDERFLASVTRSLKFSAVGVIGALIIGVLLAQLLNLTWLPSRVTNFLRGVAILPWLFATAVAALMWGLLLHRDGLLNAWLVQAGLIERPISFVGNPKTALYSLAVVFIWRVTPFTMVMVLAALKSVPTELYEAAAVDGASKWQSYWRVAIPLIMPLLLTLAILTFTWGVGQFDLIRIITGGGPIDTTQVVSYFIYRVCFLTQSWSYGATISVAVFLVNMFFALIYLYFSARSRPWE